MHLWFPKPCGVHNECQRISSYPHTFSFCSGPGILPLDSFFSLYFAPYHKKMTRQAVSQTPLSAALQLCSTQRRHCLEVGGPRKGETRAP